MKYSNEIIASAILIVSVISVRLLLERSVVKRILKKQFDRNRRKVISKVFNLSLIIIMVIGFTSIWGLKTSEIILFVSSALTVLGVAFVAQWSHLSNITAGIILFFDSSIKIGDTITILDKDFNITGRIEDIDAMSVKISTEQGMILVPNNVILQKPVKIDEHKQL